MAAKIGARGGSPKKAPRARLIPRGSREPPAGIDGAKFSYSLALVNKFGMLFPKKVKHPENGKEIVRGARLYLAGYSEGQSSPFEDLFGIKAFSQARVRSNQIEAAREALTRSLGKNSNT